MLDLLLRNSPARVVGAALLIALSTTAVVGCRPEKKTYGIPSILCAEAMRIHLKGQNVPKILRASERDEMRSQIVFELTNLDETQQQWAASCAFKRDEQKRMLLVGASLNGRVLDGADLARIADLLQRGA